MREKKARPSSIPDLLEWIPLVSPQYVSPTHLSEAAELLANYRTEPFEFVFSVPPRHGKTVLVTHFIVWALLQDPTLKIAYVSYAAGFAEDMGRDALKIAERAGLELSRATRDAWETPEGGKVNWVGVGGALTGKGYQLILVDDPVKNRVEAESTVYRERAFQFFRSDCFSRLEAGGRGRIDPSIAVIQTRWHDDDLAGRLTKGDAKEDRPPWRTINIPAIANEGTENERALCESLVPLRRLRHIRSTQGPYNWSSLYQGQPRPRGMSVFGDPCFFEEEPRTWRAAIGIDLAYSAKTSADFSVAVEMLRDLAASKKDLPFIYVTGVRRKQVKAPAFKGEIRALWLRRGRPPMRAYATGPEEGSFDFMRVPPDPLPVRVMPPVGDKFTRCIPFAAAWNDGRVLLPSPELVAADPARYGWVNDYLDEIKVFTGVKDAHDDQVDASAPAFDQLAGKGAGYSSNEQEGFSPPERRI